MLWNIPFFIALTVAIAAAVLGAMRLFGKYKRGRVVHVIHICLVAAFLCAGLLCIAPYWEEHTAEKLDPVMAVIKTAVLSFTKAVRVFGADEMYDIVLAHIGLAPEWLRIPYGVFALLIQFFAPIFTFGFVLSFFKNAAAYVRCFLNRRRDLYVFSELNERSLLLAEDLQRNHPKARIVFTDVFEDGEGMYELSESAKEMRAIRFKRDIAGIGFACHSKKRTITFFVMGENENENADHAIRLIDRHGSRENTNLYVFVTGVESELLLAAKMKTERAIQVRRIDGTRSLITRVLYERGVEIFEGARPLEGGEKQISAVVVGMGKRGIEMTKALTWYCQMDGYHLSIHAYDADPLAEERFSALCPELMSPDYNGVVLPGEAEYTIRVHGDHDVDSKKFADAILALRDATFVFVSLGSDGKNIEVATKLRTLFEQNGARPRIWTTVYDSAAAGILSEATNSARQAYRIDFIGDLRAAYSEKVVMDSELEQDAFRRHKSYCDGDAEKIEDFWRYEYCYRSSVASSLHADVRIKCGIPGAELNASEMTEAQKTRLEALEHRRWNAYMRSEGFVHSGSTDRSSRNDLGKMHHNLVAYPRLHQRDKDKDRRVGILGGIEGRGK